MTIFLILLFIVILGLIIITYLNFITANNRFKEYLLSIGDEKTSQWLSSFLLRLITEVELMMEKKYEQTKDEEYLLFSEKYRELVIRERILVFLLFGIIVIYVILTR